VYVGISFICDKNGEYSGREWPPSPSRFLQAIVAGTQGDEKYLGLLRYLETVVPTIYASNNFTEYSYETYVPDNDNFLEHVKSARKLNKHRLFQVSGLHVVYEYIVPPELRNIFIEAVSQVSALGRAMDLVVTSASDTQPTGMFDVYLSDNQNLRGEYMNLDSPVQGFIDSVFKRYKYKSKLKVTNRVYVKNPQRSLPRALFSIDPVPMSLTSYVAGWIRHAAMTSRMTPKTVAQAISGHGQEMQNRLTIVPLPTTNYNDNRIRRVVITGENENLVRQAAASLAGLNLRSNEGEDKGYLLPAEYDAVFSGYLGSSRKWASVTPVIMSGYDDHNKTKRQRLLTKMFRHAGLPKPVSVTKLPYRGKFEVNTRHGHDRFPRMMCAVEFADEVYGVVGIGTGRNYGLGIFASLSRSAAI
jgi:CRISPR-associated protein Csb2